MSDQPSEGESLLAHGKLAEAEQWFLAALASDPSDARALAGLAAACEAAKRWKDAAGFLARWAALDPNNTHVLNRLAVAHLEAGNLAEARTAMARSLEADPNQAAVRESLAAMPAPAPPPPAPARRPGALNILFVQESPCIRNYKMAVALRKAGHRVTLAYTKQRLSQSYPGLSDDVYDECIALTHLPDLWELAKRYDLVHCHNEPDLLTVGALAGDTPVVHDTHDLISLRRGNNPQLAFYEAVANRGADGRVYTTPYQYAEARTLYGVGEPSLVLYNYVSAGDLPAGRLPRQSAQDGRVHLVYEGGMGRKGHRHFTDLFLELAARGIHVHIYPSYYDERLAPLLAGSPLVHYNAPVSPRRIIEEMTQFDIGIIPFNLEEGNRRFLDATIANKLFEYLAAGLPVLAADLKSYREYFRDHPVGRTFTSVEDILAAVPDLLALARSTDLAAGVPTFEQEIGRLEAFYRQVLATARRPRGAPAAPAPGGSPAAASPRVAAPAAAPPAPPADLEAQERAKYEAIYRAGYSHHSGLKPEIVAFLERFVPEFETAIDLGCGTGKYAHFLQEKHRKMVLGVDIVNQVKFPNVRFRNQFAWALDASADFIYAIDLLEHLPEAKVPETLRAIAGHCRTFFADVSTAVDKLGDKIGQRLHLTLRPSNGWVAALAEVFEDVKVLGIQDDGFFVEARHEPSPVCRSDRPVPPDFAAVTGTKSSPYRDFWNRHAASLPWRGRVLYVGTNTACRRYYNAAFFGADEVIHVDVDPAVQPDVVASAEAMPMFADGSIDGIAFFGTPYVVNDPQKMAAEFLRVLRPGGLLAGAFNGAESPWPGRLWKPGEVKTGGETWHFDRGVRAFFGDAGIVLAWARHRDAYYYLTAAKRA